MTAARRQRQALRNQGGATRARGQAQPASLLSAAFQAASHAGEPPATHGFHAYPARMHPAIAAHLVAHLSEPGQRVLDPFCGSGTVLIECVRQGRRGLGVDLNPLALRLCEVCCSLRDPPARDRFIATLEQVTQASLQRVRARKACRAPLSARERSHYAPHVLLELAGLREEIASVPEPSDRRALEVVLSAIVVKFSRQRADTSPQQVEKRLRKGLVSEFFQRKGQELARRWGDLRRAAPASAREPFLAEGDARQLPRLLGRRRAELILSSPPYGGTYDYYDHHARRYPWLGLTAKAFAEGEIGARRRLSRGRGAAKRWDNELADCLAAMARVLLPQGRIVLLLGDAEVEGRRIDAARQVEGLAPATGLRLLATASQARKDYRGGRPRREHLLLLASLNTQSACE